MSAFLKMLADKISSDEKNSSEIIELLPFLAMGMVENEELQKTILNWCENNDWDLEIQFERIIVSKLQYISLNKMFEKN